MDELHDEERIILQKILDEQEYWLRLASLIHYFLEDLYNDLLHKTGKLPTDPSELYKLLHKNLHRIQSLLRRKKITPHQFSLIYPENEKTETWKFDISTFTFIVRYFTNIKPRGGWKLVNKLERCDKSKGALLIELENFITENIEGSEPIGKPYFEEVWNDALYILKGLKFNVHEVYALKACSFKDGKVPEKYEHCVLKAQIQYIADNLHRVKKELEKLLEDDQDLKENTNDIQKHLNYCTDIEFTILKLTEEVREKSALGSIVHKRIYEVNHKIEQVDTDMKFLKQMISFEKTAATNQLRNEMEEEDGVGGGDQQHGSTEQLLTASLMNGLDKDLNEEIEPDTKNRYRDAMRKLRSGYSNVLSRDDQDGDFECCLQAYEKLELLVKTPIKHENNNNSDFEYDPSGATYKETTICELDQMFNTSNHVLIRGIAGVGKTYLVREIISEWVYGHMFPEVKFLFVINYKEVRDKLYDNIEDLVTMLFPSVFEYVTWREILSLPDQVLLIIDNWELYCDYGYIQPEEMEFMKCMAMVLNYPDGSLTNQRMAITSRPESTEVLLENLQHGDFSIIDVLGFSDSTVESYVSHFFNCNRKMLKIVLNKLQMNEHMRHLVYLPINLWSYCCIHQHNADIGIMATATELYFNKLVMLLQENMDNHRPKKKKNIVKKNFISNGVLASSMIEAAQCSYQAHTTTHDNLSPMKPINDLLTSVYLYTINVSPLDVLVDRKFKECLPYLTAMHGSYSSALASPSTVTSRVVRSMEVEHNQDFVNQLFSTFIAPYQQIDEYYLGNDFLLYLTAYYEFQGYLVENEVFKEKVIHIKLHDMHLVDVSHLIYFLNHEHYQLRVKSIDLHTHVPITESQMEQISVHLLTIPKVRIDIKSFGHTSEVLLRVFENYQDTNEFEVKTKDFTITQAYIYDFQYAVNFDWLIFLDNFHLTIKTSDISYLIAALENAIPRALNSSNTINLSRLILTIQPTSDKLPATLLTLTKHFLYLKEIQLVLTHETRTDDYDICNSVTSSKFSGMSTFSSMLSGWSRNTFMSKSSMGLTKFSSKSSGLSRSTGHTRSSTGLNRSSMLTKSSSSNTIKRYQMHNNVRMLEVPMIKYAIYKAIHQEERIMPNNLQRIVVRDNYSCYEFLLDNNDGRVTLVVDKNSEAYIDVELISF